MNTATLPPPAVVPARTIFREFPLALPEPMESQLARRGVAPWMYAETFELFLAHVNNALRGDWLTAYELLIEATPNLSEQRADWEFMHKVQVAHRNFKDSPPGKKSVAYILHDRTATAARFAADAALAKRHTARWNAKWNRQLKTRAA